MPGYALPKCRCNRCWILADTPRERGAQPPWPPVTPPVWPRLRDGALDRAGLTTRTTSVQKELKEIERDKASGVTIKVVGSSLQKLIGYVQGACAEAVAERWQCRSVRFETWRSPQYRDNRVIKSYPHLGSS